jgi:hypothetical protein
VSHPYFVGVDIGTAGTYFPIEKIRSKRLNKALAFIDYIKRCVEENYDTIDDAVNEGDIHKTIEVLRKIFLKGYG